MAKDFADINRLEDEAGLQAANTVSTADAKQDITSRFVAMWEKKNAQRALRGGAVSTMALTLAACGGDDDDPAPSEPANTTPVADLVENAGVFELASDVDGFTVLDNTTPEITISDDEPDDQISVKLDAGGAGSGTLVLDFVDENDTLTLAADSDFGSFTALEIQDGTVDVSLADLGTIDTVTINSGIILTGAQLGGLEALSGTGSVEVKVATADQAEAAISKIGELGVTAPVSITADDGATITDAELEAANTDADAAVDDNVAAEQPSGAIEADGETVDEGDTVTFTISTQNVEEGTTLNYTISGVDGDDISGELTGTVSIDANGEAVISVELAEDQLTEGAETLTVSTEVGGEEITQSVTVNDTSVTPEPTFDLAASEASVDEGSTATFTLATTNVDAGAEYAYTLSGVSADDLASGSLSGTATVDANGDAVISVDLAEDELTEGEETLTLEVAGETADVTINDTSVTQPQAFTLTTDPDTGEAFTGGTADDTYTALGTTLTTGDDLDGGAGTDQLNLIVADDGGVGTTDVDNVVADLADIEQIFTRNLDADDDVTLDAGSWSGVEQLWYDRGTEGLVVQNVDAFATAGIREGAGGDSTVTITYDAGVVSGATDSQRFVLEDADAGAVTVDAVETFVVNSSTGTNEIDDLTGDAVTTYTLQGASDLTIGDTRDGAAQTVDASAAEGAVSVTIGNVDTDANGGFVYTGATGSDELDATGGGDTDLDVADAVFTINAGDGDDTVTLADLLSAVNADASITIDGGAGDDAVLVSGAGAFEVADIADGAITSIETVHADLGDDEDIDTTDVGGLTEVQFEGDSTSGANAVTIADGVNVRILETDNSSNGTSIAVDGSDADNTVASQQVFVGTAAEAADGGAATAADLSVGALDIDFTAALTITAESDGDDRSHTVGNITNTNNVLTGMTLAASSAALTIGTVATAAGEAANSDVFDLTLTGDNAVTTGEVTLGANTTRLDVESTGSGARTIDLADEGDLKATAGTGQAAGEGIVLSGAGTGAVQVTAAGAILNELVVDASGYTGADVTLSLDAPGAVDASNFNGVDVLQLAADNEDNAVTELVDGITIDVVADQTNNASSFELANGGTLNIVLNGDGIDGGLGDTEGLDVGAAIFNVSELTISAVDLGATTDTLEVGGITSTVQLGDDDYFDKLTLSAEDGTLAVDDDVTVVRASETSSDTDFAVDLSGAGDITVSNLDLATNDGGAGTALEITDLDITSADGGAYTFTLVDMGGGAGDAVSIDLAGAGDATLTEVSVEADEDITITSNGGGDATENEISEFTNQTGDITVTGSHDLSLGDVTAIDIGDGDNLDASAFTGDLEVIFGGAGGDSVTVTGGSGENTLTGGAEDATIIGGASDDTIEGNGGADTITTNGGSDTIVFDAGADGVDTYTDFDFGDAVDVIQGTASADIDQIGGGRADAVSTAFDGGNVEIADLAADTAAGGGDADIFVISDALDQASVALNDTAANIEQAIADQLSDGTDFLANAGGGADEGAFVLIQNDGTGGSDGFFLAEVRDSDTPDTETVAAEVNLIGIFEGTDALNAAAADFV